MQQQRPLPVFLSAILLAIALSPVPLHSAPLHAAPLHAAPLHAAPDEPRFPDTVTVEGTPLVLNGIGLCEWGIFEINLYRAALWVEVPCSDPAKLLAADAKKRIELEFCRKLSQKQMRKAYRTSFEANATEEERKTHAETIATFLATIDAVKSGDRLTMTHLPGKGLLIEEGDRKVGPLGGDDFARLLFRLYLGEKPPTKQLRRQILGDHPTPESLHRPPEDAKEKSDENGKKGEKAAKPERDEKKTPAPRSRPKEQNEEKSESR